MPRSELSSLLQLFRRAGWAPIGVIVLHQVVGKAGLRAQFDWLLHFLGGASVALFLYQMAEIFRHRVGPLTRAGRCLFTFALACTVALFWELSEFASDVFLATHVQHSLLETMLDLIYGVVGAAVCVALVVGLGAVTTKQSPPGNNPEVANLRRRNL